MFGYLNLGNPKLIGETEAQEIKNARIDQGYLEYAEFPVNELNNRKTKLPNGKIAVFDDSNYGQIKWKSTEAGALLAIGLDKPDEIITDILTGATTSRLPTVAATAYITPPYAAGAYVYAVTLFDINTNEESQPALIELTTAANEVARFTNFPTVADLFPGRAGLVWKIYRMPLGGSEFLQVNHATVLSATVTLAGPYDDIIADQDLGELCDSLDDGVAPLRLVNPSSMILYNDQLFVGAGAAVLGSGASRVFVSRQGKWWAFPPENEFNLPGAENSSGFYGFCKFGETLLFFGEETAEVLYGDNMDNFAKKPIDINLSGYPRPLRNTAMAVGGLVIFPIEDAESTNQLTQIAAFNGAKAEIISDKIDNMFPLPTLLPSSCAIIGNRYYATEVIDYAASVLAGVEKHVSLVFDSKAFGWLTADDSGQFSYRTKEFALPRQVQFHKRIWVEAEGEFTVQFLGDGNLVTSLTYSLDSKQLIYMNVRPYRYSSFSFRFVGEQGCKIYDYGVDE
ncbi:MAG: hypothetical protein KKB51_23690 [Candidatus Riflebacteria bacterium]|nr:hypothetical protein [Candidatus Riflebacteria bacterium]